MKILFKESFLKRLENQIEYISLDSPTRARRFKNDLLKRIKENQIEVFGFVKYQNNPTD